MRECTLARTGAASDWHRGAGADGLWVGDREVGRGLGRALACCAGGRAGGRAGVGREQKASPVRGGQRLGNTGIVATEHRNSPVQGGQPRVRACMRARTYAPIAFGNLEVRQFTVL